jgi:deaminated glutathione amidase
MRVALCQIPVSPDPAINLARVKSALAEAGGGRADLAVFPEATMTRFGSDLAAAAEPLDGPFCTGVAAACAAAGVAAILGVFEPAPGERVYNTAVAFDASGSLVASYRKLHLYDALGSLESETVAPGNDIVVAELAGTQVGIQICYDIRSPELTRVLAVAGARLVTVSAAWATGLFKEEHWVTLLRARAIENTVWIAATDQVPDPDSKPTHAPTGVGRSLLIDPMGVVRADLGPSAGVAVVEADLSQVDSVRAVLPSLANRRDDIFGTATARRLDLRCRTWLAWSRRHGQTGWSTGRHLVLAVRAASRVPAWRDDDAGREARCCTRPWRLRARAECGRGRSAMSWPDSRARGRWRCGRG